MSLDQQEFGLFIIINVNGSEAIQHVYCVPGTPSLFFSAVSLVPLNCILACKGKGKREFVYLLVVNTPLRRSGMARVLKRSYSFTCTPRVHPLTE